LPESFPRTTRKGHGKDTKGRNPSVGGFGRDKDIQERIRWNPFLGQPEGVMERIPRQETPQSGIFRYYEYGSSKFRDKEIERSRFQFSVI
jgi:hypothetical protein